MNLNRAFTRLTFALLTLSTLGLATDPPSPQEFLKYVQPGENHKIFTDLAGKWNYTMTWWESPTAQPQKAKGTSTSKLIFGGRYLQQEVKGKIKGESFEGMGITGFDNMRNEYQSIWLDSMSTGMMFGSGPRDPETKILSQVGNYADAATNEKAKWFRNDITVQDKNTNTFAMFAKTPDGKEYKTMEVVYKRIK